MPPMQSELEKPVGDLSDASIPQEIKDTSDKIKSLRATIRNLKENITKAAEDRDGGASGNVRDELTALREELRALRDELHASHGVGDECKNRIAHLDGLIRDIDDRLLKPRHHQHDGAQDWQGRHGYQYRA